MTTMELTGLPADDRSAPHERLRSLGRLFLSWAVTVAAFVGVMSACGLILTHVLDGTWLGALDRRLALDLFEHRTSSLDRYTGWGTFPADPLPVAIIWAAAMAIAYAVTHKATAPLLILLAVGGEKTTYFLTTLLVDRPRPDVPTIGERHVTSSYPSGHVGSAVSLYGAIALLVLVYSGHWTRFAKTVAAMLVGAIGVMVAYCRMYRGFHFLTDVVAGVVIGALWVLLATRLIGGLRGLDRRVEPPERAMGP